MVDIVKPDVLLINDDIGAGDINELCDGSRNEPNINTYDFKLELAYSTLYYLKQLKHQSRRSSDKLQKIGKLCVNLAKTLMIWTM